MLLRTIIISGGLFYIGGCYPLMNRADSGSRDSVVALPIREIHLLAAEMTSEQDRDRQELQSRDGGADGSAARDGGKPHGDEPDVPTSSKVVEFDELARCGSEVWIRTGGQLYRLQRTRQGKLILTK